MLASFDKTILSKIIFLFFSKFLAKKRIGKLVPSVLRQRFQGRGNRIFQGTVLSKAFVIAMITTELLLANYI